MCGQEFVLIQHRRLDKEPSGEQSGAPEGPDQGPRLHRAAGTHGHNGGVADGLDEAKAAFRAA
jgi:hypothetical protein